MDPTPSPAEVAAQSEQPKTQAERIAEELAQQKARFEVEKLKKEIRKLEIETEKVELDLRDLRPQWWRRPLVLAAFLPSILAIISLIYASSNGWFQVVTKDLANQRWDLTHAVDSLKRDKSKLSLERLAMQGRLNKDLARIASERASMQERLSTERAANEYRVTSERNKASLLVAAVREQAQLEKRRLEELARKVSFEALFKASERELITFHFPPKPGVADNTETDYYREPAAAAAASYVMVAILKKRDKRATELRTALTHKAQNDNKLGDEVTGMYLYTLYKGTGETAWRDRFLAKSQSVLAQWRKQPDDDFTESEYFDLFALSDWSREDREELGQFLVKNIRDLRAEPGKQATLLDLFVGTVRREGNTAQFDNADYYPLISNGIPLKQIPAFYQKYPRDFTYLLQLSRDMLLAPGNFPANDNTGVNEDRLDGPMHWLGTFAPTAMAAVTAHILVKYPFLSHQRELHKVYTRGETKREIIVEDTIKGGNWSLAYKLCESAVRGLSNLSVPEADYPPDVMASADEWHSWSASHPRLQFWLTPDLSFLANDLNQLYERLQWHKTIIRPNAPDPMGLKPRK